MLRITMQKPYNAKLLLGYVIGQNNQRKLHQAYDNLITTTPFRKYKDQKTKTISTIFIFLNNKLKTFHTTY